jgi:hypothetical protein
MLRCGAGSQPSAEARFSASLAYRNNLVRVGHVDPLDRDLHAKNLRREGHRQVVFHHRVEPGRLLGIAVGVKAAPG